MMHDTYIMKWNIFFMATAFRFPFKVNFAQKTKKKKKKKKKNWITESC